ncbi:P-loop containing nucleoside triphosphate hydrolase protein [Mycena maculata]|uniref:DNA 3'-5' helicase n=1 Tax=Mycena maculata TaxID=230809 RepID=A0AAD7JBL0_9AGAR|nr:P-loop containing nucleoside triphosphate hydrolase protein [Mycena maculata]
MAPLRGRKWQTESGRALIRKIVAEKIPEWKDGLHDWQVIIIAWILDGEDVLCITATGDGKSALFAVPIIVLLEVVRNPAYAAYGNRKKPVGLVIAPTKGLASNIVFELEALHVPALACTSDTLTEAWKAGRNIASEIASCRWPIVCIDPEHLMDKQWEFITDCPEFRTNIAFTNVDETHLIDEWGGELRPPFRHIGNFVRGRLPPHVSLSAMSATLMPGAPTRTVCKSLGFRSGMFHLYRRSNERENVQILLRTLSHTLGRDSFPDLLPYLASKRKTIIYCATIELCWRVYVFLLRLLPPGPRRLTRVRLHHAMCWPDENEKTVALMRDDPECQIIVATVAFGQGFNLKSLLDSIQLGVAKTVPQTVQQGGRVGRDLATVGRAVILAQARSFTSAQKFLEHADSVSRVLAKNSKSLTAMNNEKAMMLTTTGCLIVFFNKLFCNSTPGSQLDCIARPRRLPCSNCLPRLSGSLVFAPSPLSSGSRRLRPFSEPKAKAKPAASAQPKNQKPTVKMRSTADAELRELRVRVQKLERDYDVYGFMPASSYLSNPIITALLDNLLVIWTREVLPMTIPSWKHNERHGQALFKLIRSLQLKFAAIFETVRLEKNRKARIKRQVAAGKGGISDDEEGGDADAESEDEGDLEEAPGVDEAVENTVSAPTEPVKRKRHHVLEDATNVQPASKRVRATRAPLKSAEATAESFGPVYRPRVRRGNVENL